MQVTVREGRKGKRLEQAIAITTLSPVIPGHLRSLRRALFSVRAIPFLSRPLQELAFIHFARWTTITELRSPDPAQPPHRLGNAYLLFESNYDGSWDDYLDAFADRMPVRLRGLWGECVGFEETVVQAARSDRVFAAGPFKRFVERDEIEVLHFYGAYPEATTRVVRQALALARREGSDDLTSVREALGPPPAGPPKPPALGEEIAAWWRGLTRRFDPGPLTLALPIAAEHEEELPRLLRGLGAGAESPLAEVHGTHFARFALIPRQLGLPGEAPLDRLPCPYLLFTSNYDGDRRAYLEALATVLDRVWRMCAGWPPGGPDAAWLDTHGIETSYFVMGYPPATAQQIRAALRDRNARAERLTESRPQADAIRSEDVQGNVLRAYGVRFRVATYLLMRIAPGRSDDARALLGRWSELVAFGSADPHELRDGDGERARLNLAFTYPGLEALGAPEQWLAPFPEEFREGAAARSERLGDRGESRSSRWEFGREPSHVLLMLHATSERYRSDCLRRLREDLRAAGDPLLIVHEQPAGLLLRPYADTAGSEASCGDAFNREHFGFADGCSQPAIEGLHDDVFGSGVFATDPPRSRLQGILQAWRLAEPRTGWRGVRLGEFLLGYDDEDGERPRGSDSRLAPDGTFMVYRKLAQDVPEFRAHTQRSATELGIDVEEVRARIVGRWADGTPLVVKDRPDPAISRDRSRANAFGYREDRYGARCPRGAHVRRTNPRDDLPAGGEATMRHRLIRRGLPYGEPLEVSGPDAERGLMFICFNSSIRKGFETVQQHWCDSGHALGLDAEPDYLLQQRSNDGAMTGRLTISYDPVRVLPPPRRPFVTVRGTEYLLLPGRSALESLVGRRETTAA